MSRPTGEPAGISRRIGLRLAVFGSVGQLLDLVTNLSFLWHQRELSAPWWTPAFLAVTVALDLAVLGAALAGRLRAVVLLMRLLVAATLVLVALWPWAVDPARAGAEDLGWAWNIGVLTIASAVAFPARWHPLVLIAILAPSAAMNSGWPHRPWTLQVTGAVVFAVMYRLVFTVALYRVLDYAARVESRIRTWMDANVRQVGRELVLDARSTVDALIHDRVLTVLLAVSRAGPSERTRRDAALALEDLRDDGSGPTGTVPLRAAITQMTEAVTDRSAAAEVTVTTTASERTRYPGTVVSATSDAAAELVRNVVRHADTGGRCRVDLQFSDAGLRVLVVDDGVGFRPDATAMPTATATARAAATTTGNSGLHLSVAKRMTAIDGDSTVTSAPGRGTRAELVWGLPEDPSEDLPGSALIASGFDTPVVPVFAMVTVAALAVSRTEYLTDLRSALLLSAGLAASAVAMLVALHHAGRRISVRSTAVVGALSVAATVAAALSALPRSDTSLLQTAQVALAFVVFRDGARRPAGYLLGVVILACMAIDALAWSADGWPLDHALGRGIGDFSTILIALVFYALMQPLQASATAVEHRERDLAVRIRLAGLEDGARADRLAWARSRCDDLLARLADPPDPDGEEGDTVSLREEARLTEALLRDGIRAPVFADTPVEAAASARRAEGTEVVLLDDGGLAPETAAVREVTTARIAALLREPADRIVVRVLPPGRDALATVLRVDGEGTHRWSLTRSGATADAD